jgi:predicted RNase H-like nuclease (RuvC/YqgF family)
MGPICKSLSFLTNNRCQETIDKLTRDNDLLSKKIQSLELESIRAITEIQEQKAISHYQAFDFEKQIVMLEKELALCKAQVEALKKENKSLRNNKKDHHGRPSERATHQ